MGKLKDWLTKQVSNERTLEGEITPTYTEADKRDAPSGHMPLPRTDCEVVAYPVNADDLMVLVNKGGVCVFRSHPRRRAAQRSRLAEGQLPHDGAAHRPRRTKRVDARDDPPNAGKEVVQCHSAGAS